MYNLSEKQVVTENDLKDVPAGSKVQIGQNTILTPLAQDLISARQLELVRRRRGQSRTVAIGSDHGGFEMKEALKQFLTEIGVDYQDFGTYDTKPVDYPDYAFMVANAVSEEKFQLGIIIDGAGIGSCMVANKLPRVRAALAYTPALARNSREHNDANVLTLGGRFISMEDMREIVKAWLETSISEERHINRVAKIINIEKQFLR
jgi:ribose 5-phosphate isomerase B